MNPPGFPTWLLEIMDSSTWKDAVTGDLFEQYQERRSPSWYWRQAQTAVAIAAVKDVRRHWVLAIRTLVVACIFLYLSHSVLNKTRFIGHILGMAGPIGWSYIVMATFLEPFLTCAPAGLAVALCHPKCRGAMVLWYAVALLAFTSYACMNYPRSSMQIVLFCECEASAVLGALVGGFAGCACFRFPGRGPRWGPPFEVGMAAKSGPNMRGTI